MNFILYQNAISVMDRYCQGVEFLRYLGSGNCQWQDRFGGYVRIAALGESDYLGYRQRGPTFPHDLIFTRTFLKQLGKFVSPSLARVMMDIAAGELSTGKRLRRQGQMLSVLMPDTSQRKVIEFCALYPQEKAGALILIDVGEAEIWKSHGQSRAHKNGLNETARARQSYYRKLYSQGLEIAYQCG